LFSRLKESCRFDLGTGNCTLLPTHTSVLLAQRQASRIPKSQKRRTRSTRCIALPRLLPVAASCEKLCNIATFGASHGKGSFSDGCELKIL